MSRTRLAPLLVFVFIAVLFLPAAAGGFLETWDDGAHILANPEIRSLSFHNLVSIFTSFRGNLYKPLVTLSHAFEFALFGLDPNAMRRTNLLLHALNAALVYALLRRLGMSGGAALLGALVFGAHPLKVESVAWASQRKDVLFSAFYLSGLLCYDRFLENGSRRGRALSFLFFFLSCLSKAVAVTFPFALLLLEYKKGRKPDWTSKIPFFALSLATAVIAVRAGAVKTDTAGHVWQNALFAGHALFYYLSKLVVPSGLSAYHPYPALDPGIVLSAGLVCLLAAGFFLNRRRDPDSFFGFAFFLVTIAPSIQFVPSVGDVLVVDHYAYLPSVGVIYALVAALSKRLGSGRVLAAAGVLWVGALSAVSLSWIPSWSDDMTVWTNVLRRYPGSETAWFNRGNALSNAGRRAEAVEDYRRALELKPDDKDVWLNLGNLQIASDDAGAGLASLRKAIAIDPKYAKARTNYAAALFRAGDETGAIEEYGKALEADPSFWQAHANMGNIYFKRGALNEALAHFEAALTQRPPSAEFYLAAGNVYGASGRFGDAARCFEEALRWDPSSAQARKMLAVARVDAAA